MHSVFYSYSKTLYVSVTLMFIKYIIIYDLIIIKCNRLIIYVYIYKVKSTEIVVIFYII